MNAQQNMEHVFGIKLEYVDNVMVSDNVMDARHVDIYTNYARGVLLRSNSAPITVRRAASAQFFSFGPATAPDTRSQRCGG